MARDIDDPHRQGNILVPTVGATHLVGDLDLIGASAPLPATYEAARRALAQCVALDECKDWANKAEALAMRYEDIASQVWERLYSGLTGWPDAPVGELRTCTPLEIFSYAHSLISELLGRPADSSEVAGALDEVHDSVLYCVSDDTPDDNEEFFALAEKLEEALALLGVERDCSLPELERVDVH